jgi:phosphoglycolate phosphatase-like HAD superfamily hydrolase
MIGDTAFDIEAATKAGIKTIALRCGGWSDSDLKGAIAIYDDPADLLAHYDDSPQAQNKKVAPGTSQA